MRLAPLAFVSLSMIAAAACGSDPVSVSDPVGINLKAKSGDVSGAVISEEKDITTEVANPYGAFITDAHTKLGADPKTITIESLGLLLGGTSTGVTTLDQVFTGRVDVLFIMNDTNTSVPAAHYDSVTGAGPVPASIDFDSTTLGPADYTKLVGGSFKVVLRGTAATGFSSKGAEADLQLTFTFGAFE